MDCAQAARPCAICSNLARPKCRYGDQVKLDDILAISNRRRAEADALRAENERLRAALEKWRPIIERASDWYVRQGDVPRAKAFTAMLSDFDEALASAKRAYDDQNR